MIFLNRIFYSITKLDDFFYKKIKSNYLLLSIISLLGSFFFSILYIFIISLYFFNLDMNIFILLSSSLFINTIIVFILKYTVRRKRILGKKYFFQKIDSFSFPSGHVARLSGFIIPLVNHIELMLFFIILSFIVCFARMMKGYHYISDCIFGIIIGLISGYIASLYSYLYIDFIKNILLFFY